MICREQRLLLPTGETCVIRAVEPDDAALMLDCFIATMGETPFMMRYPDEVTLTLEQEHKLLERKLDSPTELLIGAFAGGMIVGSCGVQAGFAMERLRHRASVGVSVRRAYWRLGLGELMLRMSIETAREMGFERLELGVLEGNEGAIALYRKLGFTDTGFIPHAMKYRDGSYRDERLMSMEL